MTDTMGVRQEMEEGGVTGVTDMTEQMVKSDEDERNRGDGMEVAVRPGLIDFASALCHTKQHKCNKNLNFK